MRISDWSSDVCSSDLAQRIGELGQEGVEAFGEGGGERCERGAPRGVVTLGLGVEREQPRPAIGALESGGVRATQAGALARDLFGAAHLAGARADLGGDGQVGTAACEAEDQPPAVAAAVTVAAAGEARVVFARGLGVI